MSQTILIKYEADTAEVQKALKDIDVQYQVIEDSSEQATKTANKGMKEVSKSTTSLNLDFKQLATTIAAAFAVQQIISFGLELNKLGIQLETTGKRMEVVFGNARSVVEAEAKKMAQALGLSIAQFELMATKAGDILVPLGVSRREAANMSTEIVKLAGALAEFSAGTVTTEQAVHAVTSALTGEREMLKTLGVVLKEEDIKTRLLAKGQADLEGQALSTAKAVATLELVSEKSADAQTFFAENADSAARQSAELRARLQTLREELATKLQPLFLKITTSILNVVKAMDIDKVLGFAKAIGTLVASVKVAKVAIAALGGPLGIATGLLTTFAISMTQSAESTANLVERTDEWAESQKKITDINRAANETITEEIASLEVLFKQLKETNAGSKERAELLAQMNREYGTTLQNLEDETAFVQQLDTAYENLVTQLKEKILLDAAKEELTILLKEQIKLEKEFADIEAKRYQRRFQDQRDEFFGNQENADARIRLENRITEETGKALEQRYIQVTQRLNQTKEQIDAIKQTFGDIDLSLISDAPTGDGMTQKEREAAYKKWLANQKRLKREQDKIEKARIKRAQDTLKQIEDNLKSELLLKKKYATDTIQDDDELKDSLLQSEIEFLQKLIFMRTLIGLKSYDLELELATKTRAIREETTQFTQAQIEKVNNAMEKSADAAAEYMQDLGSNTIAVVSNVGQSIVSLGRSIADESLGLAVFEVLLNKAIAISQIFAKAQTGEPISTAVKIGLLIAQVTTGFAQISAIIQRANEQRSQSLPAFATGGIMIGGDGSSTGDRLTVRISPRESIINAESSQRYTPELIAINNGTFDEFVNERYIQPAMANAGMPIVNIDGLFSDDRLLMSQKRINNEERKRHKELLHAINGGNRAQRGRKNWY